ncbi:IF1A [Hepatospora eriocheir]|uniref:IF1A n=1 Tax=Hepatospora eriocheir TaxID=1081669 RepID=A0A1X0QAU7_9MICR|nr:IF1A [Hepatospora eriocheir]ORD99427.1 IF1A [Hepatospora eriocheir]
MGNNRKRSKNKNTNLIKAGEDDLYAIIMQPLGQAQFKIFCSDSTVRIGKVKGSMQKREWIRENDIVLVTKGIGRSDNCEIVLRYRDEHIQQLKECRAITDELLNPKIIDEYNPINNPVDETFDLL